MQSQSQLQLQRFGNQIAVCLPENLVYQMNWEIGDTVSPKIQDGQLILKVTKSSQSKRPTYKLQDLLDEMSMDGNPDLQRCENWEVMS